MHSSQAGSKTVAASRKTGGWRVKNVFHPSDFTAGSEVAFLHALKFAFLARSRLSMLHIATDSMEKTGQFPGVRETLERWRVIPPDSQKDAVSQLGLDVRKVVEKRSDPVRAVLAYLKRHPADLLVLATHQYRGHERWLKRSIAEPIARGSRQMTLFIPHGTTGFVSRENGALTLKHILIPVAADPDPGPAIAAAMRVAETLACSDVTFTLLHVGEPSGMPEYTPRRESGWAWQQLVEPGQVVDQVLRLAAARRADLIVMSTNGHNGFLDALCGSITEQVLRDAHCPLLAVPALDEEID
jgi:nucleotide-binding universal stress UspA family protein